MHAQCYTLAALPALMLMLTLTTMTVDAWGQQTPKWEIVDTATMHYSDPEAFFNHTDLAAAADEHHIVAVGSEWYARKIQHVRRTTDGGVSWYDMLVDSSRARWNAMAHPEPSLIVIAGDTSVPVGSGVGPDAEYRYHGRYMPCFVPASPTVAPARHQSTARAARPAPALPCRCTAGVDPVAAPWRSA